MNMLSKKEIVNKLKTSKLEVYDGGEKRRFDTYIEPGEFIWVEVNGGTMKTARVCQDSMNPDYILFIYNGEEVRFRMDNIHTLEIL